MAQPAQRRFTWEEYLALEQEQGVKHEFIDGEVVSMAGGTIVHGVLAMRVGAALSRTFGAGPCVAASSDVKIFIAAHNRGAYADVVVFCGTPDRAPHDRNAISNPSLIVEVLSDETEADDRGGKFDAYATLPSLREYVLIDQHEPRIDVYQRTEPTGTWSFLRVTRGEQVTLPSVNACLSVDEVYAGLELEPRRRRPSLVEP